MNINRENILLKIIKVGIVLSFFSLLAVDSSMLFPYISIKAILFRVICEISFIVYILLIINNPEYRPNFKNPLTLAVTIFFSIIFLTTFTGVDCQKSFFGNIERSEGYSNTSIIICSF